MTPLDGRRVLVVSRHTDEVEHYLRQIASRWAAWGTRVTWLTTRTTALDGIVVRHANSVLGIYRCLAGRRFDVVVDAFGLLPVVPWTPVVRIVHDGTRISPKQTAVVRSTTAAHELRRRHRGLIFVVPPENPDRAARLLAGVAAAQLTARRRDRRHARSDIATVARFRTGIVADPAALLRVTDEVSVENGVVTVLLRGCDESDAAMVLTRLGVPDAAVRLADKDDLLLGPSLREDDHAQKT